MSHTSKTPANSLIKKTTLSKSVFKSLYFNVKIRINNTIIGNRTPYNVNFTDYQLQETLKPRKTLSSWLNNRYLLIIRNEENFAEKTTISFTYSKVILISFSILIILMITSLYLSRTLMAQWFDPRHEQILMTRQFIELRLKLDSLERQVRIKDQFVQNIQKILRGEDAGFENVSTAVEEGATLSQHDNVSMAEVDSSFRKQFEQSEISSFVRLNDTYHHELQETFFFAPVRGIVSRPFDISIDHYGVDVVSKDDEPIQSIADGTVIFSDWTQEAGNVIALQHRGNIISVYKHNSALLKKVGNFVYSGEVISIIGNTGELTTGPHLHFELWYNGNPVDPEDFISF